MNSNFRQRFVFASAVCWLCLVISGASQAGQVFTDSTRQTSRFDSPSDLFSAASAQTCDTLTPHVTFTVLPAMPFSASIGMGGINLVDSNGNGASSTSSLFDAARPIKLGAELSIDEGIERRHPAAEEFRAAFSTLPRVGCSPIYYDSPLLADGLPATLQGDGRIVNCRTQILSIFRLSNVAPHALAVVPAVVRDSSNWTPFTLEFISL